MMASIVEEAAKWLSAFTDGSAVPVIVRDVANLFGKYCILLASVRFEIIVILELEGGFLVVGVDEWGVILLILVV